MSAAFDVTADTQVLWDGEEIPSGEAARRLREEWGSKCVEIVTTPGQVRIINREGKGERAFPIVPPGARSSPDMKGINQRRKRERLAGPDFQDMARMAWRARTAIREAV